MSKNKETGGDDVYEWFRSIKGRHASQSRFGEIPGFSPRELYEESLGISTFREAVMGLEQKGGTRTNVSAIEVAYPYFLEKIGKVENLSNRYSGVELGERASLVGSTLHKADVLFSIVLQGWRQETITRVIPTAKISDIESFDEATVTVPAGKITSAEDAYNRMEHAWSNYLNTIERRSRQSYQRAIPGMGVTDLEFEQEVINSNETRRLGLALAEAWAKEIKRSSPLTWEFRSDILSQREVMVATNFTGPGLQYIAILDSVTRKWKDKGSSKVSAQIFDLKTGNRRALNDLQKEIKLRQQQVMQIMAEAFTTKYLRGLKSLAVPSSGIFHTRINNSTKVQKDRVKLCGYRWFDSNSRKFEIEEMRMSSKEREEFLEWLNWYGAMINAHKSEYQKLIRSRTSYDLRSVRIRK